MFFSYADNLTDEDDSDKVYLGISYVPDMRADNYKKHIVKEDEVYRPDKIALKLYNSQDASWILDIINGFEHGIEEYTIGAEIKYLSKIKLEDAGIL